MEVKTILVILVFNIALPTLDTVTDISLLIKLFRVVHVCEFDGGPDFQKCEKDPEGYCSNEENNQNVCVSYYYCQWDPHGRDDFRKCKKDPASYCSSDENNQNVCRINSYPTMVMAMLIPFLPSPHLP